MKKRCPSPIKTKAHGTFRGDDIVQLSGVLI
ncbi:hypothetical protein TcasGA2_TC016302 [Tribolium castaneum]|uniref:Uncharacterized protein n=1 Tax=Tribolium castaneum TaxID=7070 RepID=D7GXT6_TRICA|nr:hypothetical protein TcasGA2_TC016302 [Tribolium castaneum]